MNPNHRKVQYTRSVIRGAFFQLLKEKPIEHITVSELCVQANIHRGTFYQHYHDIYDLRKCLEDQLMEHFEQLIPLLEQREYDMAELAVRMIFEERDLCEAIIGIQGNKEFVNTLVDKYWPVYRTQYSRDGIDEKYQLYVYQFATAGCSRVIQNWLAGGCRESAEEIVQIIRRMTESGTGGFRTTKS